MYLFVVTTFRTFCDPKLPVIRGDNLRALRASEDPGKEIGRDRIRYQYEHQGHAVEAEPQD
jgi:hypothetical protein